MELQELEVLDPWSLRLYLGGGRKVSMTSRDDGSRESKSERHYEWVYPNSLGVQEAVVVKELFNFVLVKVEFVKKKKKSGLGKRNGKI